MLKFKIWHALKSNKIVEYGSIKKCISFGSELANAIKFNLHYFKEFYIFSIFY